MDTGPNRWEPFLLFLVLTMLAVGILVAHRRILLTEHSPLLYHAATLGFNYFDFGFIRRGLGGSIVSLLGGNLLRATAIFHVLSAACVAAATCWFFARLRSPLPQRIAFALLLIALVLRWAEDAGRTDMLVASLLGVAAIAVLKGRLVLACVCVAIGLAVHETSFIFGVPLLVGLCLDQGRWRKISKRAVASALAVLVVAVGLYFSLDRLPHADPQTMVDVVRARLPQHGEVDKAIYYAISGERGIRVTLCHNFGDPGYLLHVLTGLLVIGLFIAILKNRGGPALSAALVVSVPPFLFISVVGADIARWAVFAAFNVWLLCAATASQPPSGPSISRDKSIWLRVVFAALAVPLMHPRAWQNPRTWQIEAPIFAPTPVIDRIVQALGGPASGPISWTLPERCDPEWRSVLGDEKSGARSR